jgi:hypothetical protein
MNGHGSELSANAPEGDARTLYVVTVTLKAPSQAGPYNGQLEIGTDLKDEPPAKVAVFATVTP